MVIARPKRSIEITQNRYPVPIHLKKGQPYIMSEGLFMQAKSQLKLDKFKKFKKYYRPLPPDEQIEDGDKLLVWRTGGIGDILFITTILNHIKLKFPNTRIKFGCAKQYQDMLHGLDFIDRIVDLPLHLGHIQTCDYSIIFENVIENNPEAEKINCYELMSKQFNIDFQEVERKYPIIKVQDEKTIEIKKWLEEKHLSDKKLILIHQRASSPIRTPTVHFSSKMVKELVASFPEDYHFLIIDMPQKSHIVDKYIQKFLPDCKDRVTNAAPVLKQLSLTMALVDLSSLVIGVDSSMIHFAAALEVPAIGLYGPFKSELRVKYYPKVVGLDADYKCCPCFKHGHRHCKEAINVNGGIGSPCFTGISYDKIIDSAKTLLEI